MNDVTCLDMYGNTIHNFSQWDLNQEIRIEDSEFTGEIEFHYQNKNTTKALVVKATKDSNNVITVAVPNQLLIEPYPITVYIYSSSNGASKSVATLQFPVYPRQQPNEFVYEDNVDFIVLEDIKNQLQDLINGFNIKIQELHTKINNLTAKDISYDNSISGADATNVQDALDELFNGGIFVSPSDKDDEPNFGGDTGDVDRVALAKALLENYFATYGGYPSNNTLQMHYESLIQYQLDKNDLSDVSFTIINFTKNEATQNAEGMISFDIVLSCGNARDSLTVQESIPKLETEDDDSGDTETETIYLYNRGVTSDLIGEWEHYVTDFAPTLPKPTVTEKSNCITFETSQFSNDYYWLSSKNKLNLDGKWNIYMEYDFSNADGSDKMIQFNSASAQDAKGGWSQNPYLQNGTNLTASPNSNAISFDENYFQIDFFYLSSQASNLNIYSIWIEKTN